MISAFPFKEAKIVRVVADENPVIKAAKIVIPTVNSGGGRRLTAEKKTAAVDLVLCGTERLGPDPEQIQIRDLKSAILSPGAISGGR